ncbi:MAG: glycosyltransferase [Bacteroidetes bacterium RIFOXYA12_FULL_35_11]|nr:MAG: glycosyltransferase [Bacteroidetes bacterium GWF2_35_48]OFY73732.1 MAG: glycosyltransferase [Bacteroidetes bacterium RIFOXYA12_FULL_35_11]OFZ01988.1 MAG: glycosyltransferase [Bacteroidetes bacterium RIFOXYC12_FULL_35_7]HBX53103.1 glycosyltransferase [Bacteroidales bacterium]
MSQEIALSIIIPIYNEEGNIPLLFDRLNSVADQLGVTKEFIFINDGSKDNSIQLIRELSLRYNYIKYINFSRNFGHQIAVTAGLDYSSGKRVAIIDADLQDPPELIIEMYNKMNEGHEVVYAKRRVRDGETVFKKTTAKLFYRILKKITSVNIPVDTGDFRIVDRKIVDVLKNMPEQEKYLRGQIAWAGFRQTYVEYDRVERYSGKTGYTFSKMLKLALNGITSFSDFPLKFATISGFIVAGIAFLVTLYALYSRFVIKEYIAGWTSLMLCVLFIGGIQLITIGIIGEYISRVAANVRKRPLYIIDDTNIKSEDLN